MQRNTFPDIPFEVSIFNESSVKTFLNHIKKKDIVLDIGCGHGDFLIEKTRENPDKFYVGIEISRKRTYKTSWRLFKRGIKNYVVVVGDGELILKLLFPENSVQEININFPDPWLRKRQWKNRILKPSFLIQVHRTLKDKGIFNFVTDVDEYAEQVVELLKLFPGFENNYKNWIEINLYDGFPTLFYRKMSALRDINYISVRKRNLL